jgi:hypothetical protein
MLLPVQTPSIVYHVTILFIFSIYDENQDYGSENLVEQTGQSLP